MKLAFSAWAMPKLSIDEQIELNRSIGYSGIEFVSGLNSNIDARVLSTSERKRIRGLLDTARLDLPSIAAHGDPLDPDFGKRAENIGRTKAAMDLAVDLAGTDGPPCVVGMGFGKPDQYETQRHVLVDAFGELGRYGSERGVVFALEPHVGQAIDTPEKCVWLLDAVDSPWFRLNFDNSHFEVMGLDMADYLPLLLPYSVHTHLKDQSGIAPNHKFLTPGDGDFDYARYLSLMRNSGYDGYVTVEISVMVQRDPAYDPARTAQQSYEVLTAAAREANVSFEAQ